MPDTLVDTLQKTIAFFTEKEVPQARLSAELLFAEALQCKRLDLYLQYSKILTPEELDLLRGWVLRRARREPWQYIIGHTDFLNLTLKTDPRALIPRPETEELVATLIEEHTQSPKSILDLGTGTGAIALALAQHFPEAEVTAVDKSTAALTLAKENASSISLKTTPHFIYSDWFQNVTGSFDWIVANPPYLTQSEWEAAEPEVKTYEPFEALVSIEEGRNDIASILHQAKQHLNPSGLIAMEIGIEQGDWIVQLAKKLGYAKPLVKKDLSGRVRFFWGAVP